MGIGCFSRVTGYGLVMLAGKGTAFTGSRYTSSDLTILTPTPQAAMGV